MQHSYLMQTPFVPHAQHVLAKNSASYVDSTILTHKQGGGKKAADTKVHLNPKKRCFVNV